jgi:predicted homoserine dehydrogenase-like protein
MIYHHLYREHEKKGTVKTGIIGTGHFGTAVVTQSFVNPLLEVSAIADSNIEAARLAYRRAGVPSEKVAFCDSRNSALRAMELGKYIIVEDAMLLMELPLDVITESTGIAEAGARHAIAAIEAGKHVAMITKETDSVVGPILQKRAQSAGLSYSPVDGDQHGLLIGLTAWARTLGLNILCAGKARDSEYLYDRDTGTVAVDGDNGHKVQLERSARKFLERIPPAQAASYVSERNRLLSALPNKEAYDLCELVIAANALNLKPDVAKLHGPIVRTVEIPDVFSPSSSGGLLNQREGTIDMVTCLKDSNDAGLGGGVFVVVACDNEYSREILTTKGCLANAAGDAILIYRPYHLCGVETATTLLCAGILGLSTGTDDYKPRFDMIKMTTRDMKTGEVIGDDHDPALSASLVAALPLQDDSPIPAHLMTHCKLKRDVPAGTLITGGMVELPSDSILLTLRREQDEWLKAGL